jgi:glycosyltransferase involved in cell wall biosynthesis
MPSLRARRKGVLLNSGFDSDKIDIVPGGVDVQEFRPYAKVLRKENRPFRFLAVGKWEDRKNIDGLVQAFLAEFGHSEKVNLILHCSNPYSTISAEERLRHIPAKQSGQLLLSTPLDYLTNNNAYLIPTTGLSRITDPSFYSEGEYGFWADPDQGCLQKLMRYVFENKIEAVARGANARRTVEECFTWRKAAARAYALLSS